MIEKITNLTSKDLLIEMCGHNNVHGYETVKTVSMKLGHELADYLVLAVGGTISRNGGIGCDGITSLGKWEFCLSRKSKNSAGHAHDQQRTPGHCVQILERPLQDRISAEQFLVMHQRSPELLLDAIEIVRSRYGMYDQLRLPV